MLAPGAAQLRERALANSPLRLARLELAPHAKEVMCAMRIAAANGARGRRTQPGERIHALSESFARDADHLARVVLAVRIHLGSLDFAAQRLVEVVLAARRDGSGAGGDGLLALVVLVDGVRLPLVERVPLDRHGQEMLRVEHRRRHTCLIPSTTVLTPRW